LWEISADLKSVVRLSSTFDMIWAQSLVTSREGSRREREERELAWDPLTEERAIDRSGERRCGDSRDDVDDMEEVEDREDEREEG